MVGDESTQCSKERCTIALFWPTLSYGGVERTGLRVAKELVRRGYTVHVVVARASGGLVSQVPNGVRLFSLGSRLGYGRLLFSVFPLARYLQTYRPAILMSSMTEANIVAVLAKLTARWRGWLILSEHSTLRIRIRRAPTKRILPLVARAVYPFADRIHAISKGVAEDLAEAIGVACDRIRVVYNPIVSKDLYVQAAESPRHGWFAPGQPPVILGVGRLVRAKDFGTLIRAFALVRNHVEARLMILGDGEERKSLEGLVRELGLECDVALPGFVDNPYKYMKRARVFVLSSLWEGFGNVLVEALALGTPVVSTDCPNGPSEILVGGRYGRLVPPGDHWALAQAIIDELRSRGNRDKEEKRARVQRALEFSVEKIVDQYEALLFPPTTRDGDQ